MTVLEHIVAAMLAEGWPRGCSYADVAGQIDRWGLNVTGETTAELVARVACTLQAVAA